MRSNPAPPSSSGHGMPSSPNSPILRMFSHGNVASASCFAATGATSSRANCRTISRTCRCCSAKYSESSIRRAGKWKRTIRSAGVLLISARAIVATVATRFRTPLAEISEHECATTNAGGGVLLHLIQLRQICDAATPHRVPIDGEAVERRFGLCQVQAGVHGIEVDELGAAKALEQIACSATAKFRWKIPQVDSESVVNGRAANVA